MKSCPNCQRTYDDDALSFCPNDGTPLVTSAPPSSFDPQATILASPPKVTNPSGPFDQPSSQPGSDWSSQTPSAPSDWGSPQPSGYQPIAPPSGGTGFQMPPPPPFPGAVGGQKTLAIWSLVLGILSLFCFGIVTGPIAIVLGIMALNKEKNEPAVYSGGKGLAYGGIALGAISVVLTILFILIAIAGGFR